MSQEKERKSLYSKKQVKSINKKKKARQKKGELIRGKWHWFLTIHVAGLLLAIITFAFFFSSTLIPTSDIILIIAIPGLLGMLTQYTYFKKKKIINDNLKFYTPLFISYNFFGIGFCCLFLTFFLNRTLASSEIVQETHKIIGTDPAYDINRWGSVVFILEDGVFDDDPYLRALPYRSYFRIEERPFIEYDFYKGLFGYRIKVDHRLSTRRVGE